VYLAAAQNLGRKHLVNPEKLKFDRIAADLGGYVDEIQASAQIAGMIARDFGHELDRHTHPSRAPCPQAPGHQDMDRLKPILPIKVFLRRCTAAGPDAADLLRLPIIRVGHC
jgi:hypothetical protein